MHHDGWYGSGGGGVWWWWIPMLLVMAVFWGGLIWLAVAFLHRNQPPAPAAPAGPPPAPPRPRPEDILAERLARGEIDPEDYRQRLDALSARPSP